MSATAKTPHGELHSEQGAVRGDRPARAKNPVIKVAAGGEFLMIKVATS